MRAKEFILKEEILNEVDWNKVKSAILGGVLSLSTLGAPNLQAKDIANMTGEEIKQYVIQKGVIKDKQQMTDLVKELDRAYGNTPTATTAPIAQPTATPVAKPTVPSTTKVEPVKSTMSQRQLILKSVRDMTSIAYNQQKLGYTRSMSLTFLNQNVVRGNPEVAKMATAIVDFVYGFDKGYYTQDEITGMAVKAIDNNLPANLK